MATPIFNQETPSGEVFVFAEYDRHLGTHVIYVCEDPDHAVPVANFQDPDEAKQWAHFLHATLSLMDEQSDRF